MDRKLLLLSIVFMIAFISFTSYVIFREPIGRFTRAAITNTTPSLQESLIFAWPLKLPADGKTQSEITIFIRDEDGRGLQERQVRVASTIGTFSNPTALTGTDGKVTFKLTSTTNGIAEIDATVDNIKLQRKVTVQFE